MPPQKETQRRVKKQPLKGKLKRKMFRYTEDALKAALTDIRCNGMGIRKACRTYDVPKTTIQDRLSGKTSDHLKKTGPPPILTVEGESKIANWALNIAKCGFPIKKIDLLETVIKIAKDTGKIHLFKNGVPGQKWYSNFLKRHQEISLREAETINKARAVVTEESVRLWFRELNTFLEANDLQDLMKDPNRIFNGDESGFALCPKTGKVLAPKGWKNLYIR